MQSHFWEEKKLEDLNPEEWEAICCNCGKCCLMKLQDEETEDLYFTNVVCKYYDKDQCRCSEYLNRSTLVPECLKLTKDNIANIPWMPKTCSYRYLFEGKGLPLWHPLITNQVDHAHTIQSRCISEVDINLDEIEDYIIDWDEL